MDQLFNSSEKQLVQLALALLILAQPHQVFKLSNSGQFLSIQRSSMGVGFRGGAWSSPDT